MKKVAITSIMSFLFLTISSITAYMQRNTESEAISVALFSIVILVISGFLSFFGKSFNYNNPNIFINIICFIGSAVALGTAIRAWYIYTGINNSLLTMLLISLICPIYLWIYYLFLRFQCCREHPIKYLIAFAIISVVIYIIVYSKTKTTFISTIGYYGLIEIAFIFAMIVRSDNIHELIRNITLSTYSIFVVVIITIVTIAGEDEFDLGDLIALDIIDSAIDIKVYSDLSKTKKELEESKKRNEY